MGIDSASSAPRIGRHRRGAAKLAAAVIALAGLAGGGAWLWGGGPPSEQRPATADTAVAATMDFDITTMATGELAAKNQTEIRSKLDTMSTIVEIVKEGERVRKGDLLVRLNGDQLQQQIDAQDLEVVGAEADYANAENELKNQIDENESAIRKAELKVALAELALEQWEQGEKVKSQTQNDQAISRARRDLDRLEEKARRSEELYAQEFLSKDELELDRIALDEARTKLITAELDKRTFDEYQQKRDRAQKQSDLTEARAELERTRRSTEIALRGKQKMLETRKSQLKMKQDKLDKLRAQLENCTITAPAEGLVVYGSSLNGDFFWDSRGPMRIGREVAPNDLIIVLPDTSEMVATVRVHESLAGRIRPGLPATLKIEAVGNAVFSGSVDSIGVLAESSGWRDPNRREYTVKLALDGGQDAEALKPSMRCEAQIRLGRVSGALAVPLQAVFNDGPVRYVFVPRGSKYVKVPVALGQRSDAYAEITAGLEPGRRVLIRQPAPAEVLETPWDPEQLRVCGLKLNDKGEPVPINPETPPHPAQAPAPMEIAAEPAPAPDAAPVAASDAGDATEPSAPTAEPATADAPAAAPSAQSHGDDSTGG